MSDFEMSEMRDLDESVSVLCGDVVDRHCLPDIFGHLRGVFWGGGEEEGGGGS